LERYGSRDTGRGDVQLLRTPSAARSSPLRLVCFPFGVELASELPVLHGGLPSGLVGGGDRCRTGSELPVLHGGFPFRLVNGVSGWSSANVRRRSGRMKRPLRGVRLQARRPANARDQRPDPLGRQDLLRGPGRQRPMDGVGAPLVSDDRGARSLFRAGCPKTPLPPCPSQIRSFPHPVRRLLPNMPAAACNGCMGAATLRTTRSF
jgi:hypothetical protein